MDLLEEYIYIRCKDYKDYYNLYNKIHIMIKVRELPDCMYIYNDYMLDIVYTLYIIKNMDIYIITYILRVFLHDMYHLDSPNVWVFIVKINNDMIRKIFIELLLNNGTEYKKKKEYIRLCRTADSLYKGWDIV